MVGVLLQPTRQEVRLPQTAIIEPIASTELREIVQIQRIDIREPLCVFQVFAGIAQFDAHRSIRLVIYSITWSARPRTDGGIVRPSAFAVLRLMTNSNLVGCSTGRSAGLAPFRIRST